MITIIFESHGTTYDSEKSVSSGHADAKLSSLGKKQAKELGKRYEDKNLDAVFCSDLSRSYKTGKIAFRERNVPIVKDKRLRECDYGDLTQHSSKEVEPFKIKHIKTPFPNGESYEQAAERMRSFLQDLLKDYDGKTVMIIGHRATQYGLEHWIKGLPLKDIIVIPFKWQPGWTYCLEKLN